MTTTSPRHTTPPPAREVTEPAAPQSLSRRLASVLARSGAVGELAAFYVVMVIVLSFTASRFATYSNAVIVVSSAAVLGIVSIGQTFVVVGGGFDLSVAGTVPLTAVLFVKFANAPFPVAVAIVLTLACGLAVGLLNALFVTRVRINPLITTLAMWTIAAALADIISNGSSEGLNSLGAAWLGNPVTNQIPAFVVLFLLLAVLAAIVLRYSVFGRTVYAIGGNPEASWIAGLRVNLASTAVYAISGALAALGGLILASQVLSSSPTAGSDTGLNSVTAVVLGGAAVGGGSGGIGGTILGVLILATVSNGLTLLQIPPFYGQVVTGVILLAAVGLGQLRRRRELL
jgi:ribose transport system permease protein